MCENPFDLTFGKLPDNYIDRKEEYDAIVNDFDDEKSLSHAYIISGARGSGKTVLLSKIYRYFSSLEDWVAIRVNPERDILEQIAAFIYENESVKHLFIKKNFSFSFYGASFSIEGENPVSNIRTLVEKMFKQLSKHGKRILICIDEVSNNSEIKAFCHDFQMFIGQEYPVYLLMTGLYENVFSLENSKSLTFLYRAKKVILNDLSLVAIKKSYQKAFPNADEKLMIELTKATNGYAYGYQLLGSLFFNNKEKIDKNLYDDFDKELAIYCYDKVFESLTESEIALIAIIPIEGACASSEIVRNSSKDNKTISVLKDRLIKKGVLKNKKGVFEFALPRFANYLKDRLAFEI